MGSYVAGRFYITKAQEYADDLVLCGELSCKGMSKSTVYRWVRELNEYYKRNGYECIAVAVPPRSSGSGCYCITLKGDGE